MKTPRQFSCGHFAILNASAAILLLLFSPRTSLSAADEYWRTDGTTGGNWNSTFWNIGSANSTGGTGWTASNNAVFSANSTLTFATATVGNVSVTNGSTVTITAGGTLTLSPLISTFDIGTGSLLTWQTQTVTANSAAGITKNGAGTLDLGALTFTTNMNGGFTLNNGTVIVSGDKALGNGALTLNGGTLQSSGTRAFAPTSITIGGDFALAGTGNANWDAATTIALGSTTRTITNSTASGSRQFRGLISGSAGAGLTFAGTGAGQLYIGNTGNTFTGPVAINGGEVVFNDNGSFGNTTSITLDGGRLTMASMNTGGTAAAITNATIASTRNIFVGATAGTAISIQGATGVTTYNGVIADKTSNTGILVKQGAGKLVLGGVSTYTGQTSINNGTVQLTTGSDRLPTGTVVNLGQSASTNLGTLDLNGNSQTIAGLTSTAGTNATASTNIVTSAAAATLTLNTSGSNSYTYSAGTQANSGIISGAISVVKTGTGTQTLGGANSYTGTTAVNGGTLAVTGSLTGSGAVTLSNSGSTLSSGTSSSIAGSVTANSGTIITPGGAGTVGTLTLGGLTLNGGSALNMDILGNSSFDKIITSGALTLGAGTETINVAGSGFTAGSFTLLSGYTSLAGSGAFALGSTPGGFNYSLSTGATSTVLTVSALGGSGNLTWSLNGLAPTSSTDGAGTWTNGGTNFYNTTTSAATTYDNTGSYNLTVGSSGAGGTITLGGNVRVGGTLTLAAVSSPYTIGTVGGTNTLTLAGGITANNSATINAPTILEASQSWNVSTGTLTANGAVSETGGARTLTKSGAGTLVLTSTSNSYSGGTTLGGGIVSVGSDANLGSTSGGLTFSGGTLQTSAGISSARSVTLNAGGGTFDTNSFDSTLSGQLSGTGTLTKSSSGTLTLSNTGNNYSGGTIINGGTLFIASGSSAGTSAGAVTVNSGATLAGGGTVNGTTSVTSGTINGSGLTLTGATTFNGSGNTVSGTVTTSSGTVLSASSALTVNGTLTGTGTAIAVSATGNNATLTNLGTISQTGTGRVMRDNTGVTGLVINNGSSTNSTALMQTADADVIQMNKPGGSVTLNNYGTMTSLNASAGGSQAVDFNAITTGSNTINNYATGIMQASEADAVRLGVNGVVNNAGLIKSTWATTSSGSSSDGIDAQSNTGAIITNASNWSSGSPTTPGSGTIEGARDGITGGALNSTVTFTTTVTNNLGGLIKGDNGSGINLDGFNANQTATIVNNGTITGNGRDIGNSLSHDGDGIDVDGLVNVTNTGIIRSINSFNIVADGVAHSEGITVGGGTITNSGTIEGLVAVGNTNAIGMGITLLGNDVTTGPLTGTREAIYGNATVTNQSGGLIRGDSGSGILVDGPASGFTVTINNNAGATIRGGATLTGLAGASAAILTGADNDTINNAGTIDGSSNGKAIDMGAGNNTLNITGGAAAISGDISGGSGGTNTATIAPGAGNTFSYAGSLSNFHDVYVQTGHVLLSGASTYAGDTTVSGTLSVTNTTGSATGSGSVIVTSTGTLNGTGHIAGNVSLASGGVIAPGLSPGTLTIDGTLSIMDGSRFAFELGSISDLLNIGGALNYTGGGTAIFDILDTGSMTSGTDYTLMNYASETGLSLSNLAFGSTPPIFTAHFNIGANALTLHVDAVPEPSRLLLGGLGLVALMLRRRRRK